MSNKVIKSENIGDGLEVDMEVGYPNEPKLEIDSLINFLISSKDNKATHLYFYTSSDDLDIQPVKEYLESDKEYKERLNKEATKQKEREDEALQGEISQYKYLRDKFKDLEIE